MKNEYEQIIKDKNLNTEQGLNELEIEDERNIQEVKITPYNPNGENDSKSKFFGYDFFTKRDSLSFWENLPIPYDYILGPGDEVILSMWGETQLRKNYTISKDGKIYDDQLGIINLSGKSILEAKDYLVKNFGRIYSTLNLKPPTSYIDISLGELRQINVNFVGEVKYPGVYAIHPYSSLISGIIAAGGIDTTGSLRKLKIIRMQKVFKEVDLYKYFLEGYLPKEILLKDNDVVFVPVRNSTVTIDSAVIRPGIYESLPGESVRDILEYAGGLSHNASGLIYHKKIKPLNLRQSPSSPVVTNSYLSNSQTKSSIVGNGDEIISLKMFEERREVQIQGKVKTPGYYNFYDGMNVFDLLELSGGVLDTSFNKSIYLDRAEIVRRNPGTNYENVIEFSIKKIINNEMKPLMLQNLDRVVVHENPNYVEKTPAFIVGEVNIPGSYSLISNNETLKSIIQRAGGLTRKAQPDAISIFRSKDFYYDERSEKSNESNFPINEKSENINQETTEDRVRVAWKNKNVKIMAGDSIVVKQKTGTINISGEIYNPGIIEFEKGKNLDYYINLAGGLKPTGNKNDIIVIYANGYVSPKRFLLSPSISDGSTILVNKKNISEPFSFTEFVQNTLSILSTTITILVLSQQINPN